eukprot:7378167-Prymnesium_polylepis.3
MHTPCLRLRQAAFNRLFQLRYSQSAVDGCAARNACASPPAELEQRPPPPLPPHKCRSPSSSHELTPPLAQLALLQTSARSQHRRIADNSRTVFAPPPPPPSLLAGPDAACPRCVLFR